MSGHKTTFTWNSDSKNKENELQSVSLQKQNEDKLFKEYYKNSGTSGSCSKKQSSEPAQNFKPLSEADISNQIDKQMKEDFQDDLN